MTVHPYIKHTSFYNFLFHPLHGKEKKRQLLSCLTHLFFNIMTAGLWSAPFWIVNRLDHRKLIVWKKQTTAPQEKGPTPPVQNPTPSQKKTSTSSAPIEETKAILYMSITGNPTHLGHMAAVATAIDVLAKKNIFVEEARISLSDAPYHQSKVQRDLKKGIKKVALSQEAREHLLEGAIEEAKNRNMFQGVNVSYWNDQDQDHPSDHPESYHRLAKMVEKTHKVYLVAGADLCVSMGNWPTIPQAIIIERDLGDGNGSFTYPPCKKERIYTPSLYSEFAKYSSTAIQTGKMTLEPAALQVYFEKQV